jgi:protocatechuate 3,4-dioxygenase beta subunit
MHTRKLFSIWTAAALIITFFIAAIGNTTTLPSNSFEQGMQFSLRQWYADHPNSQWQGSSLTIQHVNGSSSISGTVKSGGNPVKNAYLFCWAIISDGVTTQSAISDDQGKYTLAQLDAGDYYVVASAEGYSAGFYHSGRSPLDAELVSVADGQAVVGINFNLKKFVGGDGAISGQVTDQKTSAAVPGAWIIAMGRRNPFQQRDQFAVSDAQGNYKISKLPDDSYVVAAFANGYLAEVYDNVANIRNATPVVIAGEVAGINFQLAKGGSISGIVQNNDGQPMANARVNVEAVDKSNIGLPGLDVLRQMTFTGADGTYKVAGLQAGNYLVSASVHVGEYQAVKFYNDKYNRDDADLVFVDEGAETSGINFQFQQPTGKISGRVTDAQGNPLRGIYITFFTNDTSWAVWKNFRPVILTDANGRYALNNLRPGCYYVGAWLKDKSHIKGLWYDNVPDLQGATPMVLADGQQVADIDFKLDISSDYGTISGTVVYETNDEPVSFAVVQAIPKNIPRGNNSGKIHSVLLAFTDEAGAYKLGPLYRGDYYVVVRKNGYVEYFDDKTAETADVVTANAGKDTSGIDFKIPEVPAEGSIVSGNVTDEASGAPIAGALVTVFPQKKPHWFLEPASKWTRNYYASVTDADGNYKICGIPESVYIAAAWTRGYIGELFDDAHAMRDATPIPLNGSDQASKIDFALTICPNSSELGGMIAGDVAGSDGGGVEQAMVYALNSSDEIVASQVTAPDGSYALTNLESGDYRVMVNRPSFETVYYPNATNLATAKPVTVNAADQSGAATADVILSVEILTTAGNSQLSGTPQAYGLSQNYPNPFNPVTMIEYSLPESANVSLQIFNVQGRLVTTLVNKQQNSGVRQAVWNGLDQNGSALPSGVYFYQLQANDFTEIKSLILLK